MNSSPDTSFFLFKVKIVQPNIPPFWVIFNAAEPLPIFNKNIKEICPPALLHLEDPNIACSGSLELDFSKKEVSGIILDQSLSKISTNYPHTCSKKYLDLFLDSGMISDLIFFEKDSEKKFKVNWAALKDDDSRTFLENEVCQKYHTYNMLFNVDTHFNLVPCDWSQSKLFLGFNTPELPLRAYIQSLSQEEREEKRNWVISQKNFFGFHDIFVKEGDFVLKILNEEVVEKTLQKTLRPNIKPSSTRF